MRQLERTFNPLSALLQLSFLWALSLYLQNSIYDPDFYGHLILGHRLLEQGVHEASNVFTLEGLGAKWIHRTWLYDLSLAFIERQTGDQGLILWKLGLTLSLSALLVMLFSRHTKERTFSLILSAIFIAASIPAVPFDQRLFVWNFILLALVCCQHLNSNSTQASKLVLGAFFCCSVILQNSAEHAWGVATVLILYSLSLSRSASLPILVLLSVFATPFFGKQIVVSLQEVSKVALPALSALESPASLYYYPTGFLVLLWGFFFPLGLSSPAKPLRWLLPAIVLSVLAFLCREITPFAILWVCFVLSELWVASENPGKFAEGLLRLAQVFSRLPQRELAFVFLCIVVVNGVALLKHPKADALLPVHETDALVERGLFPVFHDVPTGSYLLYRSVAELRPLTAPSFLYLQTSGNWGYRDFLESEAVLESYLLENKVRSALIRKSSRFFPYFSGLSSWRVVTLENRKQSAPDWVLFAQELR